MRLLQSEGPLNFEVAQQIAVWTADQAEESGGKDGGAGDDSPGDDAMMGELTRAAQIHVVEATGLGVDLDPHPVMQTRAEWATGTLDDLRPTLTALATRLSAAPPGDEADGPADGETDLSGLLTAMAPMLLGMQAGFMVGNLATHALARYEMPLPLSGPPRVGVVAPNLSAFARDWDLPVEDLRFYVALHEMVHASARSVAWVQHRLLAEAAAFVEAFDVDPRVVEDRIGSIDPTDPTSLERALGDPTELLGAMRSPAQEAARARLSATMALLEGFADQVLSEVGRGLISSFDRVREASHRHRVHRGEAAKFLETLLGFDVRREEYEQAGAFWSGVVERAGRDGLRQLWESETRFPTPAEREAPGLWLERISLPDPES